LVAAVLLSGVAACGAPERDIPDLDLGGGLSMTASGEIKGVTPSTFSPAGLPSQEEDDLAAGTVKATDVAGSETPMLRSAAQWSEHRKK
jgi:hypothetical protein